MNSPDGIKLEKERIPDQPEQNVSSVSPTPICNYRKRDRRTNSPTVISTLLDALVEPASPESSIDQASSVDATFEPTIEMMIDDFDDEQTLNEEEAIAALEAEDPEEEISNLQKESEIPIEELIAKYREQQAEHSNTQHIRKKNKSSSKSKNKKHAKVKKHVENLKASDQENSVLEEEPAMDVIVIDSGDEENEGPNQDEEIKDDVETTEEIENIGDLFIAQTADKQKQKRSHLLDLYPEKYALCENLPKAVALETLYDGDGDDDEDDEDPDSDYVRKTIMVGNAYQAVIPTGLSKYGDVLPYENEDKLIWEPSQVSEKEVEDYLIKTREIKNYLSEKEDQSGEEDSPANDELDIQNGHLAVTLKKKNSDSNKEQDVLEVYKDTSNTMAEVVGETDLPKVIKDNEQALHLLVQCGYDFKEALRRKRLNAVPLAGSMSIWSEEECRKFEEGIQKFGKDFLRIRQQQVRTRSMRELVQFYYLWKKSERRDHEFADSDTVDHMDMYLNEGDYNANNMSTTNMGAQNSNSPSTSETGYNRKGLSCASKNFSIMKGGPPLNATSPSTNTCIAGKSNQNALTQKSVHSRRHGGHNDFSEHIAVEKSDVQNITHNSRK